MKNHSFQTALLLLLITLFLLISCKQTPSEKKPPRVVKGILDLTDWNFQKNGPVKLIGEWEFYWNSLLKSSDFKTSSSVILPIMTGYIDAPNPWGKTIVGKTKISAMGYATYRLKIISRKGGRMAFKFREFMTSFSIYVNGVKISNSGKPGTNFNTTKASIKPHLANFDLLPGETEIILNVSNFHFWKGGYIRYILLGKESTIREIHTRSLAFELFLFGALLIMGLYHIGLYVLRKEDRSTLYFSILCLCIAFRTIITGETVFFKLFPNINFELELKMVHLSFELAVPALLFFVHSLYPHEFSKKILLVLSLPLFAISTFVLFTPGYINSYTMRPFQIIMLIGIFYIIYVLIRAFINNRSGVLVFLIGFTVLFLMIANDILYNMGLIRSIYLASFGLLAFIFSQSILISMRFSNAFSMVKDLSENLEIIVEKRTQELSVQIEKITTSIKYALQIQRAILPAKERMKSTLKEYFIIYKPQAIVSGDFYWLNRIDDIIYVAVVDCTGHGVPGGFLSMIGNTLLNKIINENKNRNPAIILKHLNDGIRDSLIQTDEDLKDIKIIIDGMDICLCVIDKKNNKLTYAGAKRPLYIIKNSDTPVLNEIKGDRRSIGGRQRKKKTTFTNYKIQINDGDMIYLTSDGFVDQNCPMGRSYGSGKLKKNLVNISNKDVAEQKEFLIAALSEHQKDEPQRDDITIVGIRI